MWLEVKIVFSIIAMVFIGIVISQFLFFVDPLYTMLLFMSIGMIFIGDILIGAKIKHNDADKLIDNAPKGKEICYMVTINGLLRLLWVDKKPHGKREFVFHGQEASYINTGEGQIHTINGNRGCLVHEDYDTNIVLDEVKIADNITKDYGTDNIKEVYYKAKLNETGEEVRIVD